MRAVGYQWWIERFRRAMELVDAVRIDHFRGFVAAYEIPAGNHTGRAGTWVRGPGRAVFDAAAAAIGEVPVVAEDLGLITPPVQRLRAELGFPGSVVLQFSFQASMVNPQNSEIGRDTVVYTGTHDNDTTVGWWNDASERERSRVEAAVAAEGWTETEPHWMLNRLALESDGVLAILPAQDLLGLDSSARINVPGRAEGNWRWRLQPGQLDTALARRLRDATEAAGRVTRS
jgi:4-alpha-glucanotransferase